MPSINMIVGFKLNKSGQEPDRKESTFRLEGANADELGTPSGNRSAMLPDMHRGGTHRGRGAKDVAEINGGQLWTMSDRSWVQIPPRSSFLGSLGTLSNFLFKSSNPGLFEGSAVLRSLGDQIHYKKIV